MVFRSHLYGDEDVRRCAANEMPARNRRGTYMTDGVVCASELRVASVIMVAMRGDQDCEKEEYCREGSH